MSADSFTSRQAQDTASLILSLLFLAARLYVFIRAPSRSRSALLSLLFLLLTTLCMSAMIAIAQTDSRRRFRLSDPTDIEAYEYSSTTLKVRFPLVWKGRGADAAAWVVEFPTVVYGRSGRLGS